MDNVNTNTKWNYAPQKSTSRFNVSGNSTGVDGRLSFLSKGFNERMSEQFGFKDGMPEDKGAGMNLWGKGLQVAEIGLGVWNAAEQHKMNKFMRGYYGDQIELQSADFSNNARSTNEALEGRKTRQLDATGVDMSSDSGKRMVADHMNKYGVDESPI